MQSKTFSPWTVALGFLTWLAFAVPTYAGEDLPRTGAAEKPPPDILAPLLLYQKASRTQLKGLDRLVNAGKVGRSNWESGCRKALDALDKAIGRIDSIYGSKYAGDIDELPQPYQDYLAEERENWNRVEAMGGSLIEAHDLLVDQESLLRAKEIPRIQETTDSLTGAGASIDAWAVKGAEVLDLLATATGLPEAKLATEGLKAAAEANEFIGQVDGMSPLVASISRLYVRQNAEVTEYREQFDAKKYEARVNRVIAQRIDGDQAGVFFRHEKNWDRDLKSWLAKYVKQYRLYETASKSIFEMTWDVRMTAIREWKIAQLPDKVRERISALLAGQKALTRRIEESDDD